jgi:alkylated DNA repair dioxygenase AlkB
MGWHADDEKYLGSLPVIPSLSLGAVRNFQLKSKTTASVKANLLLEHGSLLVMRGETQAHFKHQLPKTTKHCGPRINLTFRQIIPHLV